MKTRTFLIAAVMLVALSAAAFGQAVWEVSSIPVTAVIKTGNAELPGIIKFEPYTGGSLPTTAGTAQFVYGNYIPITSPWGSVVICTNAVADATGGVVTVNNTAAGCTDTRYQNTISSLAIDPLQSTYSPGLITIRIPRGLVNSDGGVARFELIGVRLWINGIVTTGQINCSISMYNNQVLAGENVPVVINSVLDGIQSVASYMGAFPVTTASTAGSEAAAPLTGVLTPNASPAAETISIKEGFGSAFTLGVGVRIRLSAAPPKGVTFTFPTTAASYDNVGNLINPNWVSGNNTSYTAGANTSITSSSTASGALDVYYYVATDTPADALNLEYLEIPVTVTSSTGSETLPLTAASITYTVNLAPVQGPYVLSVSSTQTVWDQTRMTLPTGMLAPRFAQQSPEVGPANLLTLAPSTANTVLLMTYVSTQTGWDTGIAVANTTEDPGSAILGITGAVPSAGPITFYFFSQTNATAMFSYTTGTTTTACASGDPGSGLIGGTGTNAGYVQSGGTYVALMSNLVKCAGGTNPFQGYVIAVTGFTNAHGVYSVSNFSTIAAYSALMEVIGYNRATPEQLVF